MVCWCMLWAGAVLVAVLYVLLDVNYFLRLTITVAIARFLQRKVSLLDRTSIYSVCLPSDVDMFLKHMNNARYIRELDFARFDFYFRCGLYDEVMLRKKGGNAMQGASNIRYRRSIPIFSAYRVDTQLVWWDETAIYLEQRFVTLQDSFVRAVCLSKQTIIGMTATEAVEALAGKDVQKPDLHDDLRHWISSMEASSAKLRPKAD